MGDNLMYIRKDGKERRYYVNKRFMSPELSLLTLLGGDAVRRLRGWPKY